MVRFRQVTVLLLVALVQGVALDLFGRFIGYPSLWFAILAMLSFLGVIAFARPLFLLRMPWPLRAVRRWESQGRFYSALGVPAFGAILRGSPLRHLQPLVYLNRHPRDPDAVYRQAEGAEAAHLWALALSVPYLIYLGFNGRWGPLAVFVVVNVIGNIYPVMHLRSVRGRLAPVMARMHSRHGRPA